MAIKRITNKEEYKTVVTRYALTVEDIIKMHNEGKLHGSEYLFRLQDLQKITQPVAKGFWFLCLEYLKSYNSNRADKGSIRANKIIRDAWE